MSTDIMSHPASPGKRSYDEMQHPGLDTPSVVQSVEAHTPAALVDNTASSTPARQSVRPSPALSVMSSLTSVTATPPPLDPNAPSGVAPSPAKRRKLTSSEKTQRATEKAEKAKKREEDKVIREAKRVEELEAKRQRAEEREEKRRVREAERAVRDAAKERKEMGRREAEEALARKKAAQAKIMKSFFIQTTSKNVTPISPRKGDGAPTACTTALDPDDRNGIAQPVANSASSTKATPSDYDRTFLPYALPSSASIAPVSQFTWDEDALTHMSKLAHQALTGACSESITSIEKVIADYGLSRKRRGLNQIPLKSLMRDLSGAYDRPTNLTSSRAGSDNPHERLRKIPMKYIYHREDVRPPYIGTNTSLRTAQEARRLARRPLWQHRKELEYDYDSEEEWEEPEEGEDIGSEVGSDDDDGEEEGEMDDFLEDSGQDSATKKRFLNSDMQPVSSGLMWADGNNKRSCTVAVGYHLEDCGLEFLLDDATSSIDPFSTAYWNAPQAKQDRLPTSMQAPRLPLQPRAGNMAINALTGLQPDQLTKRKPGRPPTIVKQAGPILQGADLAAFKQCLAENSEMTKSGILAAAKVKLKHVKNSILADTLAAVAVREGRGKQEKKWMLIDADAS